MSADNWGVCPLCKQKRKVNKSLREDYELGVSDNGLCYIIYRGECSVCAATWRFKKEDILPEDEDDKKIVLEGLKK